MRLYTCFVAAIIAVAATPVLAEEHKGSGTFNWTYSPQSVSLTDTVTSTVGVVKGLLTLSAGAKLGTICSDVDLPNGESRGACVYIDADGDRLMTDWSCAPAAAVPADALFACDETSTITGGTGKYEKASGKASGTIYGVSVLPDGTVVGYTTDDYVWDY